MTLFNETITMIDPIHLSEGNRLKQSFFIEADGEFTDQIKAQILAAKGTYNFADLIMFFLPYRVESTYKHHRIKDLEEKWLEKNSRHAWFRWGAPSYFYFESDEDATLFKVFQPG